MNSIQKIKNSGFKGEILSALSCFVLGTTTTLIFLNKKEDYYFFRDSLYTPKKKFKTLQNQNLIKDEKETMVKYTPQDLKNYYKEAIINFFRIFSFPIYYQYYRLYYIEKSRENSVKELSELFSKMEKDIMVFKNSYNNKKSNFSFTTEKEEDDIFDENLETAKIFYNGTLESKIKEYQKAKSSMKLLLNDENEIKEIKEDFFAKNLPLEMKKDELLTLIASKSNSKINLSDKIYLVETKFTEAPNTVSKKTNNLWADSNLQIKNRLNNIQGIKGISSIDEINDREEKINEFVSKERELRKQKGYVNKETRALSDTMEMIKRLENQNNMKRVEE